MTTLTTDMSALVGGYFDWLRDNTTLQQVDSTWTKVSTPFLDRHNDCLEVYVRSEGEGLLLTDDGYILDDLEMSGFKLESPRRRALLQVILNGFGVEQGEDNQLMVRTSVARFAQKKNDLLQAMLAVDDLFQSATATVRTLFIEDVTAWLESHDIRNVGRAQFAGQSGFHHTFDFVIPKSKAKPERVLQTLNHATKDKVGTLLWRWTDTARTRPDNARLYVLMNDAVTSPSEDVLEALRSYGAAPVLWSERAEAARWLVG